MPHPNLIVQDQFGHSYRLQRGWFIDAPIEPERFTDDYFAERFVRHLRVDADDWIRILYEIDGQPRNTYNDNVYQDMAVLIVRGHMNVYRITHLDPFNPSHPAQGLNYPIFKDPQGTSYHLVPASLFLTHPLEGARFFKRDGTDTAQRFLDSLNLSDQQIQDIADSMRFFWWVRPRGGATPKSLRWHLGYALEQGEIAVIREAPAQATTPRAAEPDLVPATGPGNRSATLGPHDGLHNQDWQAVEVQRESFKTVKQVDMENLSAGDKAAARALERQGWHAKKVEQVLKSGNRFTTKELKPGDKLRSFDTKGKEKDLQKSAYWMDDAEFKHVETKYFKNGQWDKEGVKNHLALPCFNRATDITTVQVTQPTTGLTSTVVKARELVKYTDSSGYTTGMLGKIMGGGGQQITVNPAHVTKV